MRKSVIALVGVLLALSAHSADIVVSPGTGTLQTAIDGAMAGDTLILQSGAYDNVSATIVLDKNLTIRAGSAAAVPVIQQNFSVGAGAVLQGLTFQQIVTLGASADYGLYENTFNSTLQESASTNTRTIIAVGNEINSTMNFQRFGLIVVAGNTFNLSGGANVSLDGTQVLFVGNTVAADIFTTNQVLFLDAVAGGIWANRFLIDITASSSVDRSIVDVDGSSVSIRSNLFKIVTSNDNNTRFNAVDTTSTVTEIAVENNVFDFGSFAVAATQDQGAIHVRNPAVVRSNIFVNNQLPNLTFVGAGATTRFENNLCFNTTTACPGGDGNLTGDPLFVDTTDYVLNTGSPGIDAGPVDGVVLDIDGTTVDLGLYGGVFPIDQYDVQRQMGRVEPFTYPLFDATQGLDGIGGLQIRTVGVARLR